MNFNAYDYLGLYAELGINLNSLKAVMLDVDPIPGIADAVKASGCTLYRAPNGEPFWVDGAVGERTAHLTLLAGLLPYSKEHAQLVLGDWQAEPIGLEHIEVFTFDGYACIVAKARTTANLTEGHARLSLLPHIDLFPDYKPHVTLAYVQGSEEQISDLASNLDYVTKRAFEPRGLKFG